MEAFVLELKGITKIFPGVKALDCVQFQLAPGEIHALMGENGAGKSTFIKVITGVHKPEEGEIYLNGEKIQFKNPREAQNHSIAAIYQHGVCYPHLSVTENVFMGHEKVSKRMKSIRWKEMHAETQKLLDRLGSKVSPRSHMGDLSVAERQIVEIAKAISTEAKIIIMDEPTAALSKRECEQLYTITEKLRDEGKSIIFISHRFEDMYRLASKVTVFRDAKYIGTWGVNDISNDRLIAAMVGREVTQIYPKKQVEKGQELFRVENLSRLGYFHNVCFSLKKGEILALTGLVGAGRTEVCQSLFGIDPLDTGKIFLEGKEVHIKEPIDAMKYGIGYLPEDRQKQGLILEWELYKNQTLATLEKFTAHFVINNKKEKIIAKNYAEKVTVKAGSIFDKASSLSGGNQQKVVIAKLLQSDLKVIILDEPTKGVDVGAKSQIYSIISDLAEQGFGIIMISSEMPEVLGMSDCIAVMHNGKISAVFSKEEATQEKILEAAMGLECRKPITVGGGES